MRPRMDVADTARTRRERYAQNEAIFRRANERLAERIQEIAPTLAEFPFICECGDPRCTQIVTLSPEEYGQVRSHPARFFVVPGHEGDSDETVVRRDAHVSVIEKAGEALAAVESYERSVD